MKTYQLLSAIAIVSILILLVYAAVQQTYRSDANDPQLALAREINYRIRNGKSCGEFFSSDSVDLSQSLSLYVSAYDSEGRAIKSTGFLNGEMPRLPAGVFAYTKNHGEDVISWQPQERVRMAVVLVYVGSKSIAYIAAGRSLRETEVREGNLAKMVLASWALCVFVIIANGFLNARNKQ